MTLPEPAQGPMMEAIAAPFGLAGYRWRAFGSVAAVLLTHGYTEHAGRYSGRSGRLIPTLVASGFDVIAFDMAGHGRSAGVRGDTDVERVVQAHMAMRRSLVQEGFDVFLFGHSLGGLVSAASAAREPDAIAGVVLSAPALPFDIGRIRRCTVAGLAGFAPMAGVSKVDHPSALSRIEAEVSHYLSDPLVFKRRLPAKLAATALACCETMREGLRNWTAPTLVVHGTADVVTDPSGSERLVAAIGASDKTLILVPDGRHEPLNDLGREQILQTIVEWLDRRVRADGSA